MKKLLIILFSITMVLINQSHNNVVFAANDFRSLDNFTAELKEDNKEFKSEFAYEMAQITARIMAASPASVEDFKAMFAYANAITTAKVMPLVPSEQKNQFAYEMAQITTKVISNQNLDIKGAKVEFAYEMAQLTSKIITNAANDHHFANNEKNMINEQRTSLALQSPAEAKYIAPDSATLLRNNADIEQKAVNKVNNPPTDQREMNSSSANISPPTYNRLVDDLMHVGDRSIR